jgi:hypothetical protein
VVVHQCKLVLLVQAAQQQLVLAYTSASNPFGLFVKERAGFSRSFLFIILFL